MWFYPLIVLLVILAIVGGTLAGGVFTIVLVPLAVIALGSAVVYGMWGRAMQASESTASGPAEEPGRPLPHRRRRPSGRAPSTPDRLADARRQQQ
jgi:hypothetical protein